LNPPHEHEDAYEVLGVGFGPSNLALAIAIEEHNRAAAPGEAVKAAFVEKQECFGWHRGMLLDDATMQVSFFKDLVTMRNPTSEFTFLCYLKSRNRLVEFINQKTLFPLRIEFHDYFEWAAARLGHCVNYSSEVVSIEPVLVDGEVAYFDVVNRDGDEPDRLVVRRARNVCVATGLESSMPVDAPMSERVWHNAELVPRVAQLLGTPLRRVMVVGAGQSAAEAVAYLHRSFPETEVCAVFARYGYSPADDSPYANRIFDPEAVGVYFNAPPEVKRMLFDYHRNTNYSAVDLDVIDALYQQEYQERVQGRRRLRILNASRLREVIPGPEGLEVGVEFLPTGVVTTLEVDLLVYATGYRPSDVGVLLGEADRLCLRDVNGELRVGRDYRVHMEPGVSAGIYLQGGTEHTHGISATLLSNTAVRAGEILESIVANGRCAPARLQHYARNGEQRRPTPYPAALTHLRSAGEVDPALSRFQPSWRAEVSGGDPRPGREAGRGVGPSDGARDDHLNPAL